MNTFALAPSDVWTRELPQFLGRRAMLSLTDTPSAALLGVQTARLSRAGDDTPTRRFVAPDTAGLTAGVASMAPRAESQVLEPTPNASAPGAYPLTTLTYAAITPLALDTEARADFADFLDYATGPGQVSGLELGKLPRGYAPLPGSLRAQSAVAADIVRTLVVVRVPDTTASTTTTTTPTTVASSPAEVTTPAATRTTTARTTTATTVASVTTEAAVTTTTGPSATTTTTEGSATTTTSTPTTTTTALGLTPGVEVAGSRFAVPALGILALGSGVGAAAMTKRPRRRKTGGPFDDLDDLGDPGDD
jgi:hypothetical protein